MLSGWLRSTVSADISAIWRKGHERVLILPMIFWRLERLQTDTQIMEGNFGEEQRIC